MLQIELTLNVLLLFSLLAVVFFIGYRLGAFKMRARDKRITELEKEMLTNHAEILQLQREKVDLMKKIQETPTRVISLANKEAVDKTQDVSPSNKAAGQ